MAKSDITLDSNRAALTPLDVIADVVRACQPLPRLITSGQPAERHFAALKAAGVGIVLDLRDPMEPRPLDEPAVVAGLGMEYVNVPLGTGTLNDESAGTILGVLRGAGEGWVFMHCASGGRAGGALLPYLLLDHGLSEDEGIAEAMRVGLRTAEYLEWGLDYARRQRAQLANPGDIATNSAQGADASVRVTWAGGSVFHASRPGRPTLRMDGDGIAAPSPFDTFLASIAGCASTDVVLILAIQRTPVESLEISVEAERSGGTPRRLKALRLVFHIKGQGITQPQAERAIELSVTKYCSVRGSLAGDVPVSWEVLL